MSSLRKGYIVDPNCEYGAEVQDIHYVIFRCIKFDASKIYNKIYKIL